MNISVNSTREHDGDESDSADGRDYDESSGGADWSLSFKFSAIDSSWNYEFVVSEPGAFPLSRWREIAVGEIPTFMNIYQGNGEGSIAIKDSSQGKEMIFTAAPSGSGGTCLAHSAFCTS